MQEFNQKSNVFKASSLEVKKKKQEAKITLPYSVKLKKPLTLGEIVYTEVEFKYEPTYQSIMHLPLDTGRGVELQLGHLAPVMAAMTDVPSSVLAQLCISDMYKCLSVVAPFVQPLEDT